MKVLITGAATAQAYQLQRHLDNTTAIVLADSAELPQLPGSVQFQKIPAATSPSFAHLLLTICLDLDIQTIYPLRKNEIRALAESRQLFDEYGITVLVPQKQLIENLLSKGFKGRIVINDKDNEMPRGIFTTDDSGKEFQLFTAD